MVETKMQGVERKLFAAHAKRLSLSNCRFARERGAGYGPRERIRAVAGFEPISGNCGKLFWIKGAGKEKTDKKGKKIAPNLSGL